MHADDVNFLVEHTSRNFVFGLRQSKDKQTIYINFLRPGNLNFYTVLKSVCTVVLTSLTPTQALANAIASSHKAMNKKLVEDENAAISISIDEHIALSPNNAYLPIFFMKEKVVQFNWLSSLHMNKPEFVATMKMKDILSSTTEQIMNHLSREIDDFDSQDDSDAHMHYQFWQKKD